MPISKKAKQRADELAKAIHIAQSVNTQAHGYEIPEFYTEILEAIKLDNINSAQIKTLVDSFFVEWNESISVTVENFWDQIATAGLPFERKFPLKRAVKLNRFRNVHEAIQAVNHFEAMVEADKLNGKYSDQEVIAIRELIESTILKRVEFLRDCYNKKNIPNSKYLYFGDSFFFIYQCNLLKVHFSVQEIDGLKVLFEKFGT